MKRADFEASLIARAQRDEAFRAELLKNPKAVMARELGKPIPEYVTVTVLEETPTQTYLVLPEKPAAARPRVELDDHQLDAVAGGLPEDAGASEAMGRRR
jgi:hypothetical protein